MIYKDFNSKNPAFHRAFVAMLNRSLPAVSSPPTGVSGERFDHDVGHCDVRHGADRQEQKGGNRSDMLGADMVRSDMLGADTVRSDMLETIA